jgi:hypothetical protein
MAVCYKCGATLHAVVGMRGKCQTCFQIEVTENLNKLQEKNLKQQEDMFRKQRDHQESLQKQEERRQYQEDMQKRYEESSSSSWTYSPPTPKYVPAPPPSLERAIYECGGGPMKKFAPGAFDGLPRVTVDPNENNQDLRDGLLGLLILLTVPPCVVYMLACLGLWLLRLVVWWALFQEQYAHAPSWIWIGF